MPGRAQATPSDGSWPCAPRPEPGVRPGCGCALLGAFVFGSFLATIYGADLNFPFLLFAAGVVMVGYGLYRLIRGP